jgi:hypothetical protein
MDEVCNLNDRRKEILQKELDWYTKQENLFKER